MEKTDIQLNDLYSIDIIINDINNHKYDSQLNKAKASFHENDIPASNKSDPKILDTVIDSFTDFVFDKTEEKSEKIPKKEKTNEENTFNKPDLNNIKTESPFIAQYSNFFKEMLLYSDKEGKKKSFVSYSSPWPTYSDMTAKQLDYYFYWRSQFRKGIAEKADFGYVLLYCYEILSGVGWDVPQDGYNLLNRLWKSYFDQIQKINPYLFNWTFDFAQSYGLDYEPFDEAKIYLRYDHRILNFILTELAKSKDPIKLNFEMICALSDYNIKDSRFYSSETKDKIEEVLPRVIALTDAYFRQEYGKGLLKILSPKRKSKTYWSLYVGAITPDSGKSSVIKEKRYATDPKLRYRITNLVRFTENCLRKSFNFRGRLKNIDLEEKLTELIKTLIKRNLTSSEALLSSQENSRPKMAKPDQKLIEELRSESDEIREALEVEEETIEVVSQSIPEKNIPKKQEETEVKEDSLFNLDLLSEDLADTIAELTIFEQMALMTILSSKSIDKIAAKANTLPDLLIDSINSKSMELLGDLLIDTSVGQPEILEEYKEELKHALI